MIGRRAATPPAPAAKPGMAPLGKVAGAPRGGRSATKVTDPSPPDGGRARGATSLSAARIGSRLTRRSSTPAPAPVEVAPLVGKGRPTPKRSEAQTQRRKQVTAPTTRKEAYRRMREDAKADRLNRRRGMSSGERALPTRDQGPARAFVRDTIDARRSIGEYFLVLALVVLVLSLPWFPTGLRTLGFYAWAVMLPLILIDSIALGYRLKREMRKRFTEEQMRGSTAYGLMRSTQMRRLRMPKPRVSPGAKV